MQVQFDNGYVGAVSDKVAEILVKRGECKKVGEPDLFTDQKPEPKPVHQRQGGRK
jgi:hypothetical protein